MDDLGFIQTDCIFLYLYIKNSVQECKAFNDLLIRIRKHKRAVLLQKLQRTTLDLNKNEIIKMGMISIKPSTRNVIIYAITSCTRCFILKQTPIFKAVSKQ